MLPNEKLKEKLKFKLNNLKIKPEQEDSLIREINYLSDLIVDIFYKQNDYRKTN